MKCCDVHLPVRVAVLVRGDALDAETGTSTCVPILIQPGVPLRCDFHQVIRDGGAGKPGFRGLLHRQVRSSRFPTPLGTPPASIVALPVRQRRHTGPAEGCSIVDVGLC